MHLLTFSFYTIEGLLYLSLVQLDKESNLYSDHYMQYKDRRFLDSSVKFVSILLFAAHQYKSDQNCQTS